MAGLRCAACGATFSDSLDNPTWPNSPLKWPVPGCPRCGASHYEQPDAVRINPTPRPKPEPEPARWERLWGLPFSEYSSLDWPRRDYSDDAWLFWCSLCGSKLKHGRQRAFCSRCLDLLRLRHVPYEDWAPAPRALSLLEDARRYWANKRDVYADVTPEPEHEYPDGWMDRAPYSLPADNRQYQECHHITPGKARVKPSETAFVSYEALAERFEEQEDQADSNAREPMREMEPLRDPRVVDSSDLEALVLGFETLQEAESRLTAVEWAAVMGTAGDMTQQEIADALTEAGVDGRQWNQSAISRRLARARKKLENSRRGSA